MNHEELKEAAKQAIIDLHMDDSVSLDKTLESLEEVLDEAEGLVSLVKEDMKRKNMDDGA